MAIDLEVQKEVAKIGMTVTMGITVVTAFKMNNKNMKNLHVGAGVALVGFSLWHHLLYQGKNKSKVKERVKVEDQAVKSQT